MATEDLNFMISVLPGTLTGIASLNAGLASINNAFLDMTRQIDNNFGIVNSGIITLGAVVAQVGLDAANAFGEFEQSMKIVQMVSGQTAQDMDYLSQKANEFSVSYRMDIDQITEGLQTLGRAGLNTASEQTEVLQNGLNTAKLEGRDLNGVLEELIQNTALLGGDLKSSQFGEQSEYVNDLLVATSMTAPITTHDVSETLKYSGGIAAAAGANIESDEGKRVLEDYMGAIAAFAQKGVTGSIAGTALRAFFNKPATQDSSVVEALATIKLKPEYLWEDDQETMKPISEQIALIQGQMDKLNIPTMDRLQIWSKIVGGKMGQQMMKLDSTDIKNLTKDIQNAEDAESLATKSMKTYEANVKELTERGAKSFREFGESVVYFLNPILETFNKIMAFLDNDFMKWPLAITFFAFLSKVASKVKTVLGQVRNEFSQLINAVRSGQNPTITDLRPQSGRKGKYGYQDFSLEGARTIDEYGKALRFQKSQAILKELKDKGLSDAEIGAYAITSGWTKQNDYLTKKLGKKVTDADMYGHLLKEQMLNQESIDVLVGPGNKDYKHGLLSKDMQKLYLESIGYQPKPKIETDTDKKDTKLNDEEIEKIDSIVDDVKQANKDNTEAVKENTSALKNEADKKHTEQLTQDDNIVGSYTPLNADAVTPLAPFTPINLDELSNEAWFNSLTDKNRILYEHYMGNADQHTMKLDKGTKIPYVPSWITWIDKHPDRDVDFNRLQDPKFQDAFDSYLSSHSMHSDSERDLRQKFNAKQNDIKSSFNHYKQEASELINLPYLTLQDVVDKNKGFNMSVKAMKEELKQLGYKNEDFKGLKRADIAELYYPHLQEQRMQFYTTPESFKDLGWNTLRSEAKNMGVTASGTAEQIREKMAAKANELYQKQLETEQKRLQAEEEKLRLEQEQKATLEDIANGLKLIEERLQAEAEAKRELDEKRKKMHEESLNTDIEGNAKKDPRLIGWEEEKKKIKGETSDDKPIRSKPATIYDYVPNETISKNIEERVQKTTEKIDNAIDKGGSSHNPFFHGFGLRERLFGDKDEESSGGGFFSGVKGRLLADRPDRTFGYAKATTSMQKLANAGMNVVDMMGGPLMVAMEGLTLVINYIQGLYDSYCQSLKEAKQRVDDAYSELENAEDALRRTYTENNPDLDEEAINEMVYDTYAQMHEVMADAFNNGYQKWAHAKAQQSEGLPKYEYDEEADDGSMKKVEEELSAEEQYTKELDKNTRALYAATAELNAATNNYVSKATDKTWGIDGLSTYVSDHAMDWVKPFTAGSPFLMTAEFLSPEEQPWGSTGTWRMTNSQKDENYPGYTEMVGLMLEDFKDANGNWIAGLRTMMGESVEEFSKVLSPQGFDQLKDMAQFSSRMGADSNLRLQQSMKRDKKTWQSLAKEIAKQEKKTGVSPMKGDTGNKKLEGLVAKLQATTGGGFNRTQILQAAYMQQMQDMLTVAQQMILPVIQNEMQIAAQHLMTGQSMNANVQGTGSSTYTTAANAAIIAAYVAQMAKAEAGKALYNEYLALDPTSSEENRQKYELAESSKDADDFMKKVTRKNYGFNDPISALMAGETPNWGWVVKDGKNIAQDESFMNDWLTTFYKGTKKATYGYTPDDDTARSVIQQFRNAGASAQDIFQTIEKNYQNPDFVGAVEAAYLASDTGEDEGSGSGGGGGGSGGGSDNDDNKKTKKERVDLVLCNKKEIPKLNVNLFKKPPSFTVLNKNFKLRDIKVNTQDKPKAVLSSIKNAIIDVQKRSDPKIIQDEAAEYDPAGATDGNSVPSGSTNTSTT